MTVSKNHQSDHWNLLQGDVDAASQLLPHRKCYFEAMIRYGKEQDQCGCDGSAKAIYKRVKEKLNAELTGSQHQHQKPLDFCTVDEALSQHSKKDCEHILNSHRQLFSEPAVGVFRKMLSDHSEQREKTRSKIKGLLPLNPKEKYQNLRHALLEKVSIYMYPRPFGGAFDTLKMKDEKVGLYNKAYNTKSFMKIMATLDKSWVLDLMAHYQRLQSLKNLF